MERERQKASEEACKERETKQLMKTKLTKKREEIASRKKK